MKAQSIIKNIYRENLLEIIDSAHMRIFYGKVFELNKTQWWYLKGKNVSELNSFLAQTDEEVWEPAIQITLKD